MRWRWIAAVSFAVALIAATSAGASSVKLQPLTYRESLEQGEVKTGFIDVSNPSDEALVVTTAVEGFRQVDNQGRLEFFESEQLSAAIQLDYDELRLEPKQAMRVVFQVDGSKLPSGDVFAALLVATTPDDNGQIAQSARAGTLLFFENDTPGARDAEITGLTLPSIVTSGVISGSYTIKNTADAQTASGFFPSVELTLTPFGVTQSVESPLVYAGNQRRAPFEYRTNLIGIYRLSATYQESTQQRWVVLLPAWFLLILTMITVASALLVIRRLNRR